jgi:tetrahydromethanopterin S-methyltransferase subunit C
MTASVTTFGIYFVQVWRNFGLPSVMRSGLISLGCGLVAFAAGMVLRSSAPGAVAAPAALALFGAVYGLAWIMLRRRIANVEAAAA